MVEKQHKHYDYGQGCPKKNKISKEVNYEDNFGIRNGSCHRPR